MRNLWPFHHQNFSVLNAAGVSTDQHKIFLLSGSSELWVIDTKTGTKELVPLDEEINDLVNMTYLQLEENLIFISGSGSLYSYNFEDKEISVEGEITTGISAAQWAPSQEHLVIFAKNGSLLIHNSELDFIREVKLDLGPEATVSWRGDSKFFVVCGQAEGGYKALTFATNGDLVESHFKSDPDGGKVQNVSEKTSLLGSHIASWQTTGSLIAGIKNDKILLWEKNGLLHADFQNRYNENIKQLEWSLDGEILAIAMENKVALYYRSNYHWYLKQLYDRNSPKIHWSGNSLIILSDTVEKIDYIWKHDAVGETAIVVDGETLNITHFSQGLIPPPMFHTSTTLGFVPELLSMNSSGIISLAYKNKIFLLDSSLHELSEFNDTKKLEFAGKRLFGSNGFQIFEIIENKLEKVFDFNKEILVLKGEDNGNLWIEFIDGEIYRNNEFFISFKEVCDKIYPVYIEGKPNILGLAGNKLFLNKILLCTGCTSAGVFGDFLLFTKQNVPLSELYLWNTNFPMPFPLEQDQSVALTEPSPDHYYSRSIEKGSVIVTLQGVNVILQHNRGNLEGIYPRLVVIYKSKELIEAAKYGEAFKLLRTHKLDLNFIYDLDPEKFMTNIEKFIAEVSKGEFINLFLTSLKDQDMASVYLKQDPKDCKGKTNKICDAIREKLNLNTHTLSIITSYAAKSPPELEQALVWIQHIREKSPKKPPRPPHMHEGKRDDKIYPEDALKYLSWLVDPDKLFDVALGMYDLELTTQTAQFTQKDPKEYLPYLKALNQMDNVRKKVKICIDLKRYKKALDELIAGGEEFYNEALELVATQGLYIEGLKLFKGTSFESQAKEAIAKCLEKKELYIQSAALYESCNNYQKAKENYIKGQEWQLAGNMAKMLGEDISAFYENLAHNCGEMGNYEEAANLLQKSNDEENSAVRYLIQGGRFKQAILASKNNESKSLVLGSLRTFGNELMEDMKKNTELWKEKYARLQYVQQNKKNMPKTGGGDYGDEEIASQYSLDSAMTKASQFTKRQRKKAKKVRKTAAKEGSQFEEDYLVDLLLTLRPDLTYQTRIENICEAYILLGEFQDALNIWNLFQALKDTTFSPVKTLRHQEFLTKFSEIFPDINRDAYTENVLCDIFSKNYFLAEGLASHEPPVLPISRLQYFFKLIS